MLGAPFGLDELAFPANNNIDQAVVWAVSRPMRNAAAAINMAWLLMLVLSGLSATWCLRQLGSSSSGAFLGGTLFALSPYALYRQIDHLWMVTYLVPFASTAALLLATARLKHWYWGRRHLLLLGGCALLGFNLSIRPFSAASS